MRPIDADKLKAHYAWWGSEGASEEMQENKKTFDTIIGLQPTVEVEPKWIAVEERLPKEWEPVLAMIYIDELPERPIIDTMWFMGNIDGRNEWRVCWNSDRVESDVTHWMPLPKPPTDNKGE